jgi:[ribosomal protein S18]-alanine N-acetyltransferase
MIGLFPWPRVTIEEAQISEAEALADIHGTAFSRQWSADEFAALLSDRNVFALVARGGTFFGARRIIGFVLVRSAADEAEILSVAVLPRARGRGYGRQLIEEAMRRLYREAARICFLEVDRDNRAAVGLYRSLGFEEAGARKGYYRSPEGGAGTALVMRVQLR